MTEDILLNTISGLKSVFPIKLTGKGVTLIEQHGLLQGLKAFSLHRFWAAEQKEKCRISAELSTAIAHFVLHHKAMKATSEKKCSK